MKSLSEADLETGRTALLSILAQVRGERFRRADVVEQLRLRFHRRKDADALAVKIATAVLYEAAKEGRILKASNVHWAQAGSGRTLLDGRTVQDLGAPVALSLTTRAPEKWLAVDCETGEVWRASKDGKWSRASETLHKQFRKALRGTGT